DFNEATREIAYDTNFRVYADSDELKQKAADVKLDNYDPIEAAERMHNGYEWNDVEHEAVQFTQSAEGRRLLKDAENGRLTMLDARDILDAVEKNGMTLRYDPLPNSYVVDGWTAADGEKLDNYVVSMSELKRLAGIEISENSQQNQIQEKKTARTPEEEQAYQEWLEMLEDNQQAEDRMERMQGVPPEEQKPLPEWQQRLNTLLAATEDVSRDEQIIQAVNGSASLFIPDEREYKSYQNQLDEYLAGKLKPSDFISLGKTPAVLEKIGVNQNEVVIFQNVIDKALRQPQTDENGKFVQGHEIDVSVLEKLPEYISNPLMVFKSDTVPNSKVIMTEYQDVNDRTVVIALHCDSRADSGKLIVNRISSVYRKDNDYFFLNQIKKGNLEYIDEKRSREWAVRQRLQLPPLTDILGYSPNLTTKEDFVNSQNSMTAEKRNVVLETTLTPEELKSSLKSALNEIAKPLEIVPFTRENYNALFPESRIQTPIEEVKLGEHQFEKLDEKERQHILKAVHEALNRPDIIINEERKTVFGDIKSAHLYEKSFVIDGKNKAVQSVVVAIEDENVSISTHQRDINNVVNKIKMPEQLIYLSAEVGQVIERTTGIQLRTVNPTRVNEQVEPPKTTITQTEEKSINTQGETLDKAKAFEKSIEEMKNQKIQNFKQTALYTNSMNFYAAVKDGS
ncbi:MAG: hypothetical protein II821_04585, partial [Treponema sp.]|nr:hypothetical protein [Treponema sp.]